MLTQDDIKRLRRHMELRDARDRAKVALKNAEDAFRDSEADLYETLMDEDTGAVKRIPPVDLGEPWGRVAFGARETIYGRVIDDEAALRYFEDRAMVDEVSAPKFTMKRINELVRDAYEQGEQMPPGLDFRPVRGVTITRQKD